MPPNNSAAFKGLVALIIDLLEAYVLMPDSDNSRLRSCITSVSMLGLFIQKHLRPLAWEHDYSGWPYVLLQAYPQRRRSPTSDTTPTRSTGN
jgi:hypothetical protein